MAHHPIVFRDHDSCTLLLLRFCPMRGARRGRAYRGSDGRAGGHEILRDVDLDVTPGSHVAMVGPSGAGKSSLAGLLLGWPRWCGRWSAWARR